MGNVSSWVYQHANVVVPPLSNCLLCRKWHTQTTQTTLAAVPGTTCTVVCSTARFPSLHVCFRFGPWESWKRAALPVKSARGPEHKQTCVNTISSGWTLTQCTVILRNIWRAPRSKLPSVKTPKYGQWPPGTLVTNRPFHWEQRNNTSNTKATHREKEDKRHITHTSGFQRVRRQRSRHYLHAWTTKLFLQSAVAVSLVLLQNQQSCTRPPFKTH